jgi:hypothetical protein
LAGLAARTGGLLQRDVVVTGFHADDDDRTHASWGATAYVRIVLSSLPLLEASGGIMVTVNVREAAAISADLLLFAAGVRIRGPGDCDLFHLAFTSDSGWASCGWMPDDAGEWESSTTLASP